MKASKSDRERLRKLRKYTEQYEQARTEEQTWRNTKQELGFAIESLMVELAHLTTASGNTRFIDFNGLKAERQKRQPAPKLDEEALYRTLPVKYRDAVFPLVRKFDERTFTALYSRFGPKLKARIAKCFVQSEASFVIAVRRRQQESDEA